MFRAPFILLLGSARKEAMSLTLMPRKATSTEKLKADFFRGGGGLPGAAPCHGRRSRWISSDRLKTVAVRRTQKSGHAALPDAEPRSEHGDENDAWKISEALEVIETVLDVFSLRSRRLLEPGSCSGPSMCQ
ncbi:hypothetical protein B0T11DRAFT_280516 [Plectosphaerella cucumerina]|uniref:Uncharacterized protein n=1 Tax=Plectosphaerella cucumerina TaxID=40658 RepID=A0A8K0X3K0_9PEZI|nr:hypothetical protein B0T11DRAFT_280516 [Plectosphaerella cucumerina]